MLNSIKNVGIIKCLLNMFVSSNCYFIICVEVFLYFIFCDFLFFFLIVVIK